MGKVKSALVLAFSCALIVVLCFFSLISFQYKGGLKQFNSALSMTTKDATLGGTLVDGETYMGGGYQAVYYPDGVISLKEYEDNLSVLEGDKASEYAENYVRHGALYLEKDVVIEDGKVSEEFETKFENTVKKIQSRYDALHIDGAKVAVANDYTVQVFLPEAYSGRNAVFQLMTYTGEVTIAYGSSEDSATTIIPENKKDVELKDYLKGFSTKIASDGTAYVVIKFTKAGAEIIKNATADASSSSGTMYFKVGDNSAIQLSVSSQIDQKSLYISGSYTKNSAQATAVLLGSSMNMSSDDEFALTADSFYRVEASFGGNAMLLLYIAFSVLFAAMGVFFFVRYGSLGFVHLFTYLLFFFPMLLCVWAIPFLSMSVGTVIAMLIASLIFCLGNVLVYEYAKKEFAAGRTMTACVKAAYKNCFWKVFDIHIIFAAFAFIVYGIGLTALSSFAFVLGLALCFSGVCSILVGRLIWASMMSFTGNKGAFCHFKREEIEDDE